MLAIPDLAKFGRSDQLHAALYGIREFVLVNKKYPAEGDIQACKDLATAMMKKGKEGECLQLDIEDDCFKKAISYSSSSISPMAAFFGGIMAQEIVKYTGKYTPMKQWLHFDIYETLPRGEVNKAPLGCRYDD